MKRIISLAVGVMALISMRASALSVGDQAPDFTLTSTDSTTVSFSKTQGQVRVIFFFGCG